MGRKPVGMGAGVPAPGSQRLNTEPWTDELTTLLEDCEKREAKLTAWEHDLIVNVRDYRDAGRPMSKKQVQALNDAWDRVTSK